MFFFQDDIGILIQLATLPFWKYLITPWSAYFSPIFRLVSYIEYNLFGLQFIPYVFFTLLFHFLNIFLIGKITTVLTNNRFLMYLSMLLFSINLTFTEPLLWFTVQTLPLATFFIGLAFLYWWRFLHTGNKNHFYKTLILQILAGFSFGIGVAVSGVFLIASILFKEKIKRKDRKRVLFGYGLTALLSYAIGPLVTAGKIGHTTPIIQNVIKDFILYTAFIFAGVSRGVVGRFFLPGFEPRHFEIIPTIISFIPFFVICYLLYVLLLKKNENQKKFLEVLIVFVFYPYVWAGFLRFHFGMKQALAERYAYPSLFFFVLLFMYIINLLLQRKLIRLKNIIIICASILILNQSYFFFQKVKEFEILPLQTKTYFQNLTYIFSQNDVILDLPLPSFIHQEYSLSNIAPLFTKKKIHFINLSGQFCTKDFLQSLRDEKTNRFYVQQLENEEIESVLSTEELMECINKKENV